jgi:hypothetical protein
MMGYGPGLTVTAPGMMGPALTPGPGKMGPGMLFLQPRQVPVGPGMMGPGMSGFSPGMMQYGMMKGPGMMMGHP